jgi:hypothetical protein
VSTTYKERYNTAQNFIDGAFMSESELQRNVIDMARYLGWYVHAERPAMTSKGFRTAIMGNAGFPDMVLCRGNRLIFVELKSAAGTLTEQQVKWGKLLSNNTTYYVWRPSDWFNGTIEEVLK